MNKTVASTNDFRTRDASLGWHVRVVGWILLALVSVVFCGCSHLRLPKIDPTGARIFEPLPSTTNVALPGTAGEGGVMGHLHNKLRRHGLCGRGLCGIGLCGNSDCLKKIFGKCSCGGKGLCGKCLHGGGLSKFGWPKPAFQDPAEPPKCLTPETPTAGGAAAIDTSNEPCVPSVPCTEDCKNGPPAVLLGREVDGKKHLKLAKRGKRGCILLSPQRIVAPVGGEVVLLSGICGDDGYLQVGEPLEWMLTPDSVGTFIQVGDDDPGFLHRLAHVSKATKHDPSYAHGVTSSKRTLITRGNADPRDDVQLEKGQTWITLSSPSEGTSRVTVLAPESDCWDNRKATATIYWVDARWVYPKSDIVSAGTAVKLNTRVTRSEGSLPARGWKVRYTILEPGLATFAGTEGSSVVEAVVGDDAIAAATLLPIEGSSGSAAIKIEIIRPGGVSDNIPDLTLSSGQTFVTWSAPQLSLEAGAPEVASFNQPFEVVAKVENRGNQPAENVVVTMRIPEGITANSTDSFAQNVPSAITWNIGTIPPGQGLDLFATVIAQAPVELAFEARADGLVSTDSVQIDVYRPSLMMDVQAEKDRYETGQNVTFNIDVKNTGERPIENMQLAAVGDGEMVHEQFNKAPVKIEKKDGPLQPGDTWPVAITLVPTDSGRRCVNFVATGSGGQRAEGQECVTVINPIPATPALTAKLDRRGSMEVGQSPSIIRGRVTNTGEVPLTNVRVTMTHDPQLELLAATTEGFDRSQLGKFIVGWTIPRLEPGQSKPYEMQVRAVDVNPRSQIIMTARSNESSVANDSFTLEIVPNRNPQTPPRRDDTPTLPPLNAPPTIPGGQAPIPAPGNGAAGGNLPVTPNASAPANQRSNQLLMSLVNRDNPNRVNEPIRCALRVQNDTDVVDGQIRIQFNLPNGVRLERVVQTKSPELGRFDRSTGLVHLEEIRTMRPGETIDYELVLFSNQPQTFDLVVEGESLQTRNVARAQETITVVP